MSFELYNKHHFLDLLFKKVLGLNLLTFFIFLFVLSLVYQIKIFDKKKPTTCLKAFKVNNLSGLIYFFGFLSIGELNLMKINELIEILKRLYREYVRKFK